MGEERKKICTKKTYQKILWRRLPIGTLHQAVPNYQLQLQVLREGRILGQSKGGVVDNLQQKIQDAHEPGTGAHAGAGAVGIKWNRPMASSSNNRP